MGAFSWEMTEEKPEPYCRVSDPLPNRWESRKHLKPFAAAAERTDCRLEKL